MVNGTLLNFGKIYKDDSRVIFDQWPKLHLGLDALSNQKILKVIYYVHVISCEIPETIVNQNLCKSLFWLGTILIIRQWKGWLGDFKNITFCWRSGVQYCIYADIVLGGVGGQKRSKNVLT